MDPSKVAEMVALMPPSEAIALLAAVSDVSLTVVAKQLPKHEKQRLMQARSHLPYFMQSYFMSASVLHVSLTSSKIFTSKQALGGSPKTHASSSKHAASEKKDPEKREKTASPKPSPKPGPGESSSKVRKEVKVNQQ
eukprot:565859-Pelagomonas_calceolata.AAC.5